MKPFLSTFLLLLFILAGGSLPVTHASELPSDPDRDLTDWAVWDCLPYPPPEEAKDGGKQTGKKASRYLVYDCTSYEHQLEYPHEKIRITICSYGIHPTPPDQSYVLYGYWGYVQQLIRKGTRWEPVPRVNAMLKLHFVDIGTPLNLKMSKQPISDSVGTVKWSAAAPLNTFLKANARYKITYENDRGKQFTIEQTAPVKIFLPVNWDAWFKRSTPHD